MARDVEIKARVASVSGELIFYRRADRFTPRGATYSRESYLGAVEEGRIVYLKWEAADILVRRFAGVALLRYRAELEMPDASGEHSSFGCWHTDSYELHNGFWQVVWSQATRIR
jgi:hypothetical protein